MSCLVTRPAIPVPGTCRMSTLCSAAILRTTGDERVCRSSSAVMSARGFSAEGGAGGAVGADAGCGRGAEAAAGGTFITGTVAPAGVEGADGGGEPAGVVGRAADEGTYGA